MPLLAAPAASALLTCLVVHVGDGDSLVARCDEAGAVREVRVRVADVDAPERGQPFGDRSRRSLAQLCDRQPATLVVRTTDRYGRLVADVGCRGRDAAAYQVRAGLASVYDRYVVDRTLYALQATAAARQAGLWSDAGAVPPWAWRRAHPGRFDRDAPRPQRAPSNAGLPRPDST